VLCVVLALAACGGEKKATQAPTSTPGSSLAGPSATRPAGVTATARPSTSPTATSPSSAGRLSDLNSYHYEMRIEGTAGLVAELTQSSIPPGVNPNTGTMVFEVKGAYVKPDRGEVTMTVAGNSVVLTTIGRQQWTNAAGTLRGPANLNSPAASDYSFIASFWDADAGPSLRDFTCGSSRETVNAVSTRKCSADRATIDRLNREGKLFSSGPLDVRQFTTATAEIWVNDDGKVIRLRTDLTGMDSSNRAVVFKMQVDITNINASITINQPR